jgi:hypothetical protein
MYRLWGNAARFGAAGFISIIAALFGSASGSFAQSFSDFYAFPDDVRQAIQETQWLTADIDEDAPCTVMYAVERESADAFKRLDKLISEAKHFRDKNAADALQNTRDDLADALEDYRHLCRFGIAYVRIQPSVEVKIIRRRVLGVTQRLAQEINGALGYDYANENQNGTGTSYGFNLRFPIARSNGNAYFLQTNYSFTSLGGSASGTTAGPFNIPGLGVGPFGAGLFTSATTPVEHFYDFDTKRHAFELWGGVKIRHGAFEITPAGGFRYNRMTVSDSYQFTRPSPPNIINGVYTTDSTVNSYGAVFGLGLTYRPRATHLALFADGRVGFDYNSASSDVALDITSPLTISQAVTIGGHKTTPYLAFDAGIRGNWGPFSAYVKGEVEQSGGMINIAIPGGGAAPSAGFEKQTEYKLAFGLTMYFPPGSKHTHR